MGLKKKTKYKRVLLKLSGEAFKGKRRFGIDYDFLGYIAREIKKAKGLGVQIAIVTGGGNIYRGLTGSKKGVDRSTADYMGMMATIFNGLALQERLEREGLSARLLTAIEMKQVAEPFIRRRAIRHLEKGRVVILGGGTGLPFITTDSAAALRALELNCKTLVKATKVDGIYEEDPVLNPKAQKFERLSFEQAFKDDKINIVDKAAISLCRRNNIKMLFYNILQKGSLWKILSGYKVGTIIS